MKQKNCIVTDPVFEEKLREAVDDALLCLGNSSRDAVYYHLEKKFNLKRENIPQQSEEFARALTSIFGPGEKYILNLAVKNLCLKLNLTYKKRSLQFFDFVVLAQRMVKDKATGYDGRQFAHKNEGKRNRKRGIR